MEIVNLFPTSVGAFNLGRDFTEKELEFIKSQEKRENVGNTTSIKRDVLESEELADLKLFVTECLDTYFKEIFSPRNEVKLKITQSWCNYSEPNQWHHKHHHPNSIVSGVLYIQGDRESDRIFFHNPRRHTMKTPVENYNLYNSETWWLTSESCKMYLFPSDFEHSVEPVKSKETRISLSFNTFPVGNWGEDDSLTGLRL